jgi:hypothetical protein
MIHPASDRQLLLLTVVVWGSLGVIVAAILGLMVFGRPRDRNRHPAAPGTPPGSG